MSHPAAAAREPRTSAAARLLIALGVFLLFGCVMMAAVLLPFEREVGFTWVTTVLAVDALAGFAFVTLGILKTQRPVKGKH
ncbi:MAG TPA: hypothetical protein VLE48_00755 [Terriglobales bacterium]|nr:hypothetical protein [Terriglobales bacterium]